ncbi:MAG: heme ABC transporter permease CcmC, partial [Parvibaculaceae bacterium]
MAGMSSLSAAQRFHAYANPARFMALSARLVAPLGVLTALLIAAGLWFALVASPPDYQQSETVRIMYVHVPSAWLALFGYSVMAVASAVALIFRHPLADVAAKSAAPIGAAFTFLALVTGSLWGRPMWGTWWEWGDARLVSMLILLFLYLGYMALWATIEEPVRAARAAAVLALVGSVNLPIIRYSVD